MKLIEKKFLNRLKQEIEKIEEKRKNSFIIIFPLILVLIVEKKI